ncbi:MAG: hypothetical protein MZU97_09490 [Bacillus subtilis]|nr:hypothetical protein [Bacillus subtilis]
MGSTSEDGFGASRLADQRGLPPPSRSSEKTRSPRYRADERRKIFSGTRCGTTVDRSPFV